MQTIETPRAHIAYRDYRADTTQTPTLLIHGAGGQHLDFPPQLRRANAVNAIVLDLPGHGQSPGEGRTTVADYAADVAALLDALDIEKAVIVGHSMGGAIAQTLALDYAPKVAALILISTGARLPVNDRILNGILEATETTAEMVMRWSWAQDTDEQTRQMGIQRLLDTGAEVIYNDYAACNAFDALERLPQITMPTLVLCGAEDRMTPPAWSKTLNENIPNATLQIIDGGGHMVALEQAPAVTETIVAWLTNLRER